MSTAHNAALALGAPAFTALYIYCLGNHYGTRWPDVKPGRYWRAKYICISITSAITTGWTRPLERGAFGYSGAAFAETDATKSIPPAAGGEGHGVAVEDERSALPI